MRTDDPVIIYKTITHEVTASDVGGELACGHSDDQAAMLACWAEAVGQYGPNESWPAQCRFITEHLTPEERIAVSGVLRTLLEYLQ